MDKTVGEMLDFEELEYLAPEGVRRRNLPRKEGRKKFILPVCRKEWFRVELFSLNHQSQAPVPLLDS
jgi:hypothetical protein